MSTPDDLNTSVPILEEEDRDQGLEDLGPERQFAIVELSGQSLAVEVTKSRNILEMPSITPVPFTPDYVLGVANIRGDIYSVVDIRSLLELAPADPETPDPLIVLLDGSRYTCGITVESISEIAWIREGQIAEPTTEIPYVSGIHRREHGQNTVMIVDVEELMASPEMCRFQ